MKTRSKSAKADALRPEYNLAALLNEGTQGKFAKRYKEGSNLVLLAPDVATAFPSDKAVNEALRLVIRFEKSVQTNCAYTQFSRIGKGDCPNSVRGSMRTRWGCPKPAFWRKFTALTERNVSPNLLCHQLSCAR